MRRRLALALGAGLVALVACMVAALLLGPQPISLSAALAGVEPDRSILIGLRLPRVILGALVGAALAAAGVALQALLRNPLAEPFVLALDDGHLLTSDTCWRLVATLLEHLPEGAQVAVGTRMAPALPLARLRAAGGLAEYG
ncbi:MAG: iron chelate uptake ABC transporter family permease subunit, partial [Deltaproteobacteria bacterium]